MSIVNFIPTVWNAGLLMALDKALVYNQAGVVNRDYEGDITAFGDRVTIVSIGDVTIRDYARNTDLADPEELTAADQELIIDQAKYFNFAVDDLDRAQIRGEVMTEAMRRAAYGLRDTADQRTASVMAAAVPSANQVGSESSPKTDLGTAANAYNYLVDLGTKLNESNTPIEGRWVIIPPWFQGVLLKDDRFVKSGVQAGEERLMNGMVGRAAGFNVLMSNNVPSTTSTTKFKIIAGIDWAASYAEQIVKTEAYRPEKRMSDAVKGLHVYGQKVVRPSQLAMLVANQP